MDKLQWSHLEYEEKERGGDWFWALGIIIVTSAAASIIYHNYFFATLIILSGMLLGFFAIKKPEVVTYELNEKGLKIRSRLYLYESMESFWVRHTSPSVEDPGPMLFIKSERIFMPIITVPLTLDVEDAVHEIMLAKNVPEEEMREHISEKVMDYLGF